MNVVITIGNVGGVPDSLIPPVDAVDEQCERLNVS
jgi:hypothetical protein